MYKQLLKLMKYFHVSVLDDEEKVWIILRPCVLPSLWLFKVVDSASMYEASANMKPFLSLDLQKHYLELREYAVDCHALPRRVLGWIRSVHG